MASQSELKTGTNISLKGGEFVIRESNPALTFIPEEFNEEQRLVAQTTREFLDREITPNLERIDQQEPGLVESLLDKAGELGLLGTSVPEAYGGFGMSFVTSMLVAEILGRGHSFAVTAGAHTGIGTLPILYYGNDEQKSKYIPGLADGSIKAAYCLTEPDSGSDANSGKTKAVLSPDGKHYLLSGQKMWITNGGFADLFTVFAKMETDGVPDKNLSAFIVERSFGGITMNPEEHKMGIKGSSTRQIFFNDCPVPVENLLSERGNGFKIAVNILNIGRIKLAVATIGGSKNVIDMCAGYALERKQFGVSISTFGAIQFKLAEMMVRTWVTEAATFRATQNIDDAMQALREQGMPEAQAKLKGIEQFAIECAILKVHASEVLDYVTDEGVQIYGGMGFSAEAPMDRAYRDSRINRIFEGTNEINRILALGTLIKRGMKGELSLLPAAMAVAKELTELPDFSEPEGFLGAEKRAVANFKKAFLLAAGAAAQKLGLALDQQQEIMMNLSDILIEVYASESALLRAWKIANLQGEAAAELPLEILRVYIDSAAQRISASARTAINGFAEGDEQRMLHLGIKRWTKVPNLNTVAARRKIAAAVLAKQGYLE
ncbi:MAG: acyl-CoA dehydrogenase family protein [Bacteroidota bacterium]